MSKIIQEFTAKRVIFDTTVPIDEVVARLDEELSKDRAGPQMFQFLEAAKTREELEEGFQKVSHGKDFV